MKAHTGIQGNETVDRLAKEAATEGTGEIVYDKKPRKNNYYRREEDVINEMAGSVDRLYKWSIKKKKFSIYKRQKEDCT